MNKTRASGLIIFHVTNARVTQQDFSNIERILSSLILLGHLYLLSCSKKLDLMGCINGSLQEVNQVGMIHILLVNLQRFPPFCLWRRSRLAPQTRAPATWLYSQGRFVSAGSFGRACWVAWMRIRKHSHSTCGSARPWRACEAECARFRSIRTRGVHEPHKLHGISSLPLEISSPMVGGAI